MRTLSTARFVGTSFCIIVFFSALVMPLHSQTLIPLYIKKGTNLIHLAGEYCHSKTNWREIARINKLKPPYLIREKSTLQIPLALLRVKNLTARVALTKDTVSLLQGEKTLGTVQNNDQLHPGQTLETDADGYAYIVFPDNKFTRVAPKSKLTLNYLLRLADGDLKTELLLTKGKIRHLIKQKLRRNETFRTRTPVAVTGVRGTDFRIKVSEDGSNTVETLSGTVQLSASGNAVALHQGEGSRVVEGMAPLTPRLLPASPQSISLLPVYKSLPVVFSLPAQEKIVSYRVVITADEEGNEPLLEKLVPAGKDAEIANLTDGKYYCSVTAIDTEKYESLPAGPYPLVVRTVPGAPFFSSPKDKAISWEDSMTITWLESDGAVAYQYELAADKEFTRILSSGQTKESSYTATALKPATYFFKVRAVAADGFTSLDSFPLSWQVLEQKAVEMSAPAEDGSLTIQWASAGKSATYDFQIATDTSFQEVVFSRQGLTEPACTIKQYLEPGDYAMRIRFALEDGQYTPWMPSQKMTIEAGPVGLEHIVLVVSFFILILL